MQDLLDQTLGQNSSVHAAKAFWPPWWLIKVHGLVLCWRSSLKAKPVLIHIAAAILPHSCRSDRLHLIRLLALRKCHQSTSNTQTLGAKKMVPSECTGSYTMHSVAPTYEKPLYIIWLMYIWPLARRTRQPDSSILGRMTKPKRQTPSHARGFLDVDRARTAFARIAAAHSDV